MTVTPIARPPRRTLPIQSALEWAFGVEHAHLDFAEDKGDNLRPGVSPVWVVMQRGALGCAIDGGGYSLPSHDADIIASAVAHLPDHVGGRTMALRIAELARAGQVPDWGRDLRPRCIPKGFKNQNRYGLDAVTEQIGEVEVTGARGRKVRLPVLICPVTYTASAQRIADARAQYLAWVEALAWLAMDLRARPVLDRITISAVLPDPEPWLTVEAERRVG